MTLFHLHKISFAFPGFKPLLYDITLTLGAKVNERIGITGSTGAGKTTLLHVMIGLHSVTRGDIIAFGKRCVSEEDFQEVRKYTGLLFQDPNDQLFCPTVIEDVTFGCRNLGWDRTMAYEAAYSWLEKFKITHLAEQSIYRLSWGEKRLVALAGILAMKPDVLLLDEPNLGLDPQAEKMIVEILNALSQAMVIVAHDQRFLNECVSRILVLKDGTLIDGQQKETDLK